MPAVSARHRVTHRTCFLWLVGDRRAVDWVSLGPQWPWLVTTATLFSRKIIHIIEAISLFLGCFLLHISCWTRVNNRFRYPDRTPGSQPARIHNTLHVAIVFTAKIYTIPDSIHLDINRPPTGHISTNFDQNLDQHDTWSTL